MIKALFYGLVGAGAAYYGYNYYLQNQSKINRAVSNAANKNTTELKHDAKKVGNDVS
jgi:hypothetical protein